MFLYVFGVILLQISLLRWTNGQITTTPSTDKSSVGPSRIPLQLKLRLICAQQPNGTFIPLSHTVCMRMFILCNNGIGAPRQCNAARPYVNPDKAMCDHHANIKICQSSVKPLIPPELDGATLFCRQEENNCDSFNTCCFHNCINSSAPICSSNSDANNGSTAEYDKSKALCGCRKKIYWHRRPISENCISQVDTCVGFTLCCMVNGCPIRYVQCRQLNDTGAVIEGWRDMAKCYC